MTPPPRLATVEREPWRPQAYEHIRINKRPSPGCLTRSPRSWWGPLPFTHEENAMIDFMRRLILCCRVLFFSGWWRDDCGEEHE